MRTCDVYQMAFKLVGLYSLMCIVYTPAYSQSAYPSYRCSLKTVSTSMCDFNKEICYSQLDSDTLAWEISRWPSPFPVDRHEGNYVYLNPKLSGETPKRLLGRIASDAIAVCVEVLYATAGTRAVPIDFYIGDSRTLERVHHITARTGGKWELTTFVCCLPNIGETKQFAIEATSTDDGVPAIDSVAMTYSNMPCENGELVCYPSLSDQLPLDPDGAPECPSDLPETAVPSSCEFSADDQKNLTNCGWKVSSAWEVRQKIDGSGKYNIIVSSDMTNPTLLSDIEDDVISLCVEIQFSVPSQLNDDLKGVFSVNIISNNSSLPWGTAYNYAGRNSSVWKRNFFDEVLPEGSSRQIEITSNIKELKIDYIRVRTSEKLRTTPEPVQWQTIFSCPPSSVSQFLPLCGMTHVPGPSSNATLSESGWSEVEPGNSTENIFTGRDYYLLYNVTDGVLERGKVTTGDIESNQRMTLTFSYAISGDAHLAVYTAADGQTDNQVWISKQDTDRAWVSAKVAFQRTEPYQLIFSAERHNPNSQENLTFPAYIGLTDISLTTPVASTTTNTPNTTMAEESTSAPTTTTEKINDEKGKKKFDDDDDDGSPWEMEVMITIGVIIFFIIFIQIAALTYQRIKKNRSDSDPES